MKSLWYLAWKSHEISNWEQLFEIFEYIKQNLKSVESQFPTRNTSGSWSKTSLAGISTFIPPANYQIKVGRIIIQIDTIHVFVRSKTIEINFVTTTGHKRHVLISQYGINVDLDTYLYIDHPANIWLNPQEIKRLLSALKTQIEIYQSIK